MHTLPEELIEPTSDSVITPPQGSLLGGPASPDSRLPDPRPQSSTTSSEDPAATDSQPKSLISITRQHISEGNQVKEQPSLEHNLHQIEVLMAEKEDYEQELNDKNAEIKKREALVLTLNEEIIRQDITIFDLYRRDKQKDAALMAKDRIIADLETKVK